MRRVRAAAVVALAITAAGCRGSAGATTPSATVVKVVISGPAFALLGGTPVQLTATASLSDGTTTSAGIAFSSSTPSVLTVSASGLVTSVANGQATIAATLQQQSGTLVLRVIPDMHGSWEGMLLATGCQAQPAGSSVCDDLADPGTAVPFPLTLVQKNDTLTGTLTVEGTVPVSGTIAVDGTITLSGTAFFAGGDPFDTVTLEDWRSALSTAGVLSGSFALVFTSTTAPGTSATLTCTFQSATRAT